MSQYPPGVTGNEPEIAGYVEGMERMTCGNMIDADRLIVMPEGSGPERVSGVTGASWKLSNLGVDEVDCPFVGSVDVIYQGEEAVATCPLCANEMRGLVEELRAGWSRKDRKMRSAARESTPEFMRRTDPTGWQHARDAGRL